MFTWNGEGSVVTDGVAAHPQPFSRQCNQWVILFPALKEDSNNCCLPRLINRVRGESPKSGLRRTLLQQPLSPSYSKAITLSSSPQLVVVIHMMLYHNDPRAQRQTDRINSDYDGSDNIITMCNSLWPWIQTSRHQSQIITTRMDVEKLHSWLKNLFQPL